jgi:hypothetical protein
MSEPVVVLGMHRSGTSFLIRALNLMGLWLGRETDLSTVEGRAMIGNPKGNYENREAIAINNAIIMRSGGAWFNPPLQILASAADVPRIRTFCEALEHGCPANFRRWGWKDPRTVLTLDVWLGALKRPIFVIASFRHPTAVAQSLLARDKIPMELGYALWIHYNTLLLKYIDTFPHVLVRFDVPREFLLAQTLRVCELARLTTDRHLIESWFDATLVRHNAQSDDIPRESPMNSLWNELIERHRSQFPSSDCRSRGSGR